VLRRIAGQLFWAARYLERAEWRSRLIDVNYHLILEVPPHDADPWEPLLAITGEGDKFGIDHSQVDETSVVNFFTFARENPSSIRSCIESARTNLSSLRHLISSELWLEVNRLYLDAQMWSPNGLAQTGMSAFYAELRERFYAIIGIIGSTLPRDLAYDFIQTGTMLERADNVSRLLDVKYHYLLPRSENLGGQADIRQWAAVLRSASALEAFRRTYGNAIRVDRVVELLVFNPEFPRSMRFCADRIALLLERIAARQPENMQPTLSCENLRAPIVKGSAAAVIDAGLHEFLLTVQQECAAAGQQIFDACMSLG
jgi:uncharacterized alpha-E superfamily protein